MIDYRFVIRMKLFMSGHNAIYSMTRDSRTLRYARERQQLRTIESSCSKYLELYSIIII